MRLLERNPRLSGLMMGLAVLALVGVRAQAQNLQVSSTEPGSIAVFPKVISDGTRDTIISLTNTSNLMAYVHCEATNGIGICRNSPDPDNQVYYCNNDLDCLDRTDPSGAPVTGPDLDNPNSIGPCDIAWQPADFTIALTAQQPTFWRVSTGRVQDTNLAASTACTTDPEGLQLCPGYFFGDDEEAGRILPAPGAFRGELRCFQVDSNGDLMTGNAIKGEAFIEELIPDAVDAAGTGRISGYNSVNFEGGETPSDGQTAPLNDVNYARCPDSIGFDSLAPGQQDPFSGADAEVEATFVPCSFNTANPTSWAHQYISYDEQEFIASGAGQRTCWANDTGSVTGGLLGRTTTYIRARAWASQDGNCDAASTQPPDILCSANSDCGRGGVCNLGECLIGSSVGRVCSSDTQCPGGACGPPSRIIGVVETVYSGAGTGSDANVMYQLSPGTVDNEMIFTGGF